MSSERRLCGAASSPTAVATERLAPAGQELREELLALAGLGGERRESHAHGEGHVVALGARGHGAAVGRVRGVHPDRRLFEPSQLGAVR